MEIVLDIGSYRVYKEDKSKMAFGGKDIIEAVTTVMVVSNPCSYSCFDCWNFASTIFSSLSIINTTELVRASDILLLD